MKKKNKRNKKFYLFCSKAVSGITIAQVILAQVLFAGVLFFPTSQALAATTLFSDGFESEAHPTHNGFLNWTSHGLWGTTNNSNSGAYAAEIKNTGDYNTNLVKTISTSGYNNIVLNYSYKIVDPLDSHDHVYVEWSLDGTNWNLIIDYAGNDKNNNYNQASFVLDGAQNNSNFRFRFRAYHLGSSDKFRLDDVSLTGLQIVLGCTDPTAFNYNPQANIDDGSCTPVVSGCTDPTALNYNPQANTDDGSCIAPIPGCTNSEALNYNPEANIDDGSCIYPVLGCTDEEAINFNPEATQNDGSCIYPIYGCTDTTALNYNPDANTDDGSCVYPVLGCTNPEATNYNAEATQDDGSCEYPPEEIPGCTDPAASNYNGQATIDDGSCTHEEEPIYGCTDPEATNYKPEATEDDQSCTYEEEPTDVCPNIEGAQETVPQGLIQDDQGNCVEPKPEPYCGDGTVNQSNEQCDGTDGVGEHQFCSTECTLVNLIYCGDGLKNGNEECDGVDGVGLHQACTSECKLISTAFCGDGVVNGDEECDGQAGVTEPHYTCTLGCTLQYIPYCGDNHVDTNLGEACDDGNMINGDGCSANCEIELYCGDGIKNGEEQCDGRDGVGEHQSCNQNCILTNLPYCGDSTCNNDETCSTCSQDCGACSLAFGGGGGGGGNPSPLELMIYNEVYTSIIETGVTITWTTNYAATSQVIYGAEGEAHTLNVNDYLGNPPLYGYAHTTPEFDTAPKVINHLVIITGLTPGTVYYYRTVSHGSLAFGEERTFTTPGEKQQNNPAPETGTTSSGTTSEVTGEIAGATTKETTETPESTVETTLQPNVALTQPFPEQKKPLSNNLNFSAALAMTVGEISRSTLFSAITILLIILLVLLISREISRIKKRSKKLKTGNRVKMNS